MQSERGIYSAGTPQAAGVKRSGKRPAHLGLIHHLLTVNRPKAFSAAPACERLSTLKEVRAPKCMVTAKRHLGNPQYLLFSCINVERELHRSIVNPGQCQDFRLQRKTH